MIYYPRYFLMICVCGNLKTSLARVSHCINVIFMEFALIDILLASFLNTTCSLLIDWASWGLEISKSLFKSENVYKFAKPFVLKLLKVWTKKYIIVFEYWNSLVESKTDYSINVSSSIFACSFSNYLTCLFNVSKSFNSSSPPVDWTSHSSLCTEEFFYVILVQSKRNTVYFFLLTTEFRLISFMRSY